MMFMEQGIQIWQDFIRNGIHPGQLVTQVPKPDTIENYLIRSAQLRQDFIDRLINEMTIANHEDQLKVLIYGYQTLLCYYINTLFEYQETTLHENPLRIYQRVVKDLENNLGFIQLYYTRYFDFQAAVPFSLRKECKSAITLLDDQLTANGQLNISCRDLHPLLVALLHRHTDGPLPYAKYYYLTRLVNNFLSAPFQLPALFDSHLMDFCIVKNVNDPEIISYVVSCLSEKFQLQDTIEQKKDWVTQSLKQLYQLSADYERGLLEGQPSVRDSLANWLEQEKLHMAVQKIETIPAAEQSPKLNTSVSVPVLALFTRLFKESGIITNSNLQEIFRFVTTNYTSQRKETISPGNFHGKYYTVEESTKRKVTDMLLDMVKVVKRIP